MPEDLHSSLKPLFKIFRVFGLAPFEYNSKKRKFDLSCQTKKYVIFVLVMLPIFGLATFFIKSALVPLPPSLERLLYLAEFTNQTCMHATYGSFLLSLLWYRERVVGALNSLLEIDKSLLECPRIVYRRTKRFVCVALSCIFIFLSILEIFDYLARSLQIGYSKASLLLFTYLVYPCVYFGNLQFMSLILLVNQRLGIINSEIEDVVKKREAPHGKNNTLHFMKAQPHSILMTPKKQICTHVFTLPKISTIETSMAAYYFAEKKGKRMQDIESRIQNLKMNHYKLFKVARVVNDFNGLPLLLTLMTTLTSVIVNTHVFMRYVSTADDKVMLLTSTVKLLWATGYALLAFQLALVSHKTRQEYSNTASLIQDILYDGNRNVDKTLKAEFNSFLSQISNTGLSFSANGFCDIDFGLLCGMSGAVLTYLIVLFQI